MLVRLRADATSILLTTHQLDEAERRCDRIAILVHGRVIAAGSIEELIRATSGARKTVVLCVENAPPTPPEGFVAVDGAWTAEIADVGRDLAPLLARAASTGASIGDLEVRRPTLQSVFLHLTGRELRE